MKSKLPQFPSTFVDPITGYYPSNEVQMSGLLGLFHQMGRVTWSRVPLLLPANGSTGRPADELLANAVVCGEYQLFWKSESEMKIWGSMPADLICLSPDRQSVIIVENKIGSGFTGVSNDPVGGQLAKQADFLVQCKIPKGFLVLLSTTELFNKGWYKRELSNALDHSDRRRKVTGYLMRWEDVLAAVT